MLNAEIRERTDTTTGHGIVEYSTIEEASRAIENFNKSGASFDHPLSGLPCNLEVNYARDPVIVSTSYKASPFSLVRFHHVTPSLAWKRMKPEELEELNRPASATQIHGWTDASRCTCGLDVQYQSVLDAARAFCAFNGRHFQHSPRYVLGVELVQDEKTMPKIEVGADKELEHRSVIVSNLLETCNLQVLMEIFCSIDSAINIKMFQLGANKCGRPPLAMAKIDYSSAAAAQRAIWMNDGIQFENIVIKVTMNSTEADYSQVFTST